MLAEARQRAAQPGAPGRAWGQGCAWAPAPCHQQPAAVAELSSGAAGSAPGTAGAHRRPEKNLRNSGIVALSRTAAEPTLGAARGARAPPALPAGPPAARGRRQQLPVRVAALSLAVGRGSARREPGAECSQTTAGAPRAGQPGQAGGLAWGACSGPQPQCQAQLLKLSLGMLRRIFSVGFLLGFCSYGFMSSLLSYPRTRLFPAHPIM